MRHIVAFLLLALTSASSLASIIFYAVAIPAEQTEQVLTDDKQLLAALSRTDGTAITLDKAWHGMHYLMTGSIWSTKGPLAQAITGGKPVGKDLGYGPARVLSPQQVQEVARALEAESSQTLSSRFDATAMDKAMVYPPIWEREGMEGLRYVLGFLPNFQAFYKRAAEGGLSVVLILA